MITDTKKLFLLSLLTISFAAIADNPGDVVVDEETETVTEEVVESTPAVLFLANDKLPKTTALPSSAIVM